MDVSVADYIAVGTASTITGEDCRPVLLKVNVELSEAASDTISVRYGDDPDALAAKFCQLHSLQEALVPMLSEHIRGSLDLLRIGIDTPPPREAENHVDEEKNNSSGRPTKPEDGSAGQAAGARRRTVDRVAPPQRKSIGMSAASKARASAKEIPTPSACSASVATAASGKQPGSGGRRSSPVRQAPSSRSARSPRSSTDCLSSQPPGSNASEPARRRPREVVGSGPGMANEKDICDRLHREAELRTTRLQRLQLQHAERQRQEEDREATFCPEINASQRKCRGVARARQDPEGLAIKNKIERLRDQHERAMLRDCTFQPQVDQKSEAIMSERAKGKQLNGSLHEALYEDALRRQERKDYYEEFALHVPTVSSANLPTLLQQQQLRARSSSPERLPCNDRDIAAATCSTPCATQTTSPRRHLSVGSTGVKQHRPRSAGAYNAVGARRPY